MKPSPWLPLCLAALLVAAPDHDGRAERPRVIVETDAGGDPDDEQSLVRLLLYANDLEVEGILANRPVAREGENLNPERTGTGIVHRLVAAYAECQRNLREHDPRYPTGPELRARVVDGGPASTAGVDLLIAAVDREDTRPLWFCNWGTDAGSGPSSLKRALDRVLRERGEEGYARFKSRLRLASADRFGEHTTHIAPSFPLWVDTFGPERGGRRWYHRFSAVTATAGGFDLRRDVLENHGPLGALYPQNTRPPQKEGDTMTFLYLIPTGVGDPERPDWGSWAGRYGRNPEFAPRPYYHANQEDTWRNATGRDETLARWAEAMQNDFRSRLDWCVSPWSRCNHPPRAQVRGGALRRVRSGEVVALSADDSRDPDVGQSLLVNWFWYPEAGSHAGPFPELRERTRREVQFTLPTVGAPVEMHLVLAVSDTGSPTLTRYARVVFEVTP